MSLDPSIGRLFYLRPDFKTCPQTSRPGPFTYFSFAREALVEAFRRMGLQPGSAVLLPEFICRDVLSSLHTVGAKAVYYPLAENFAPATDSAQWPDAAAVLAVNFFGFPQDLGPFNAYARRTGATVIEDNAHGFLSQDQNGLWLGQRAAYGLFSFRKTLPLAVGAGLFDALGKRVACAPQSSDISSPTSFKLVLKSVLATMISRGVFPASLISKQLSPVADAKIRAWETDDPKQEEVVPHGSLNLATLHKALTTLNIEREQDRRRKLYETLYDHVAKRPGIRIPFGRLLPHVTPYMFVFIPENDTYRDAVLQTIVDAGLRFIRWPDLPMAVRQRPSLPVFYSNVWAVPFMWS